MELTLILDALWPGPILTAPHHGQDLLLRMCNSLRATPEIGQRHTRVHQGTVYVYICIYIFFLQILISCIYPIYILYIDIYTHHKSNPSSTFSTTLGPWLLFTPNLPKKRPEGSLRISKMVRNCGMASKNAMASEAPKMILRQETFRKYFLQKK